MIPLLRPSIPTAEKILPYLKLIDENRWYTNFGPLVAKFENRLADYLSNDLPVYVCTTSNCTTAITLTLQALALPKGARILMPAFTFIATACAVEHGGFEPLLADVDSQSWLLTPEIAELALTQQHYDAVVATAALGNPQNVTEWDAFTARTGIPVVIDAAGAFGNQKIGSTTHVVFSFHATKALGIGEGGAIVSSNHELIERSRSLSNFGLNGKHAITSVGTNGKLSEYHAAVGLASLNEWTIISFQRKRLRFRYLVKLRETCPQLQIQQAPENGVYSILAVLLPENLAADEAVDFLANEGIESRRWYYPLIHQHSSFQQVAKICGLKTSQNLSQHIIGLPFHLELETADIEHVCRAVAALSSPASQIVKKQAC